MLKRLLHLLAAAGVVLAVAPSALALTAKKPKHPSSCVSAVCVYREPNVPGVGGPSYGGGGGSSGGGGSTGGAAGGASKPLPLPPAAAHRLDRYGGKDKPVLKSLATNPGSGGGQLPKSAVGRVAAPSALGATFDMSSGLGVLVAVVLGTGIVVIAFGNFWRWRRS